MGEQKKDESCSTGCGCCAGTRKLIVGLLLGALIFMTGFIFGKGYCPFGSGQKMCPVMQR